MIDFFLSFVVISFIGLVLTGVPLLNRIAGWVTSRSQASTAASVHKPGAPVAPAVVDQEIPIEDVVAISAVLSAVLGEHRVLRIEPVHRLSLIHI